MIHLNDEFEYADVPDDDDEDNEDDVGVQPSPPAQIFQDAVRDRWLREALGWE